MENNSEVPQTVLQSQATPPMVAPSLPEAGQMLKNAFNFCRQHIANLAFFGLVPAGAARLLDQMVVKGQVGGHGDLPPPQGHSYTSICVGASVASGAVGPLNDRAMSWHGSWGSCGAGGLERYS